MIAKGAEGLGQRKTKEATLVANAKQYAMMRAVQDDEY